MKINWRHPQLVGEDFLWISDKCDAGVVISREVSNNPNSKLALNSNSVVKMWFRKSYSVSTLDLSNKSSPEFYIGSTGLKIEKSHFYNEIGLTEILIFQTVKHFFQTVKFQKFHAVLFVLSLFIFGAQLSFVNWFN